MLWWTILLVAYIVFYVIGGGPAMIRTMQEVQQQIPQ